MASCPSEEVARLLKHPEVQPEACLESWIKAGAGRRRACGPWRNRGHAARASRAGGPSHRGRLRTHVAASVYSCLSSCSPCPDPSGSHFLCSTWRELSSIGDCDACSSLSHAPAPGVSAPNSSDAVELFPWLVGGTGTESLYGTELAFTVHRRSQARHFLSRTFPALL